MDAVSQEVARMLLETGAVWFDLSSSCIYRDGTTSPMHLGRDALLYEVTVRNRLAQLLSELVRNAMDQANVITGRDVMSVLVAERLGLPYVQSPDQRRRFQGRPYGLRQEHRLVTVGTLEPDCYGIWDAVATVNRITGVRDVKLATVLGPLSQYARGRLESFDIETHHALTNYTDVVETAVETGRLAPQSRELVLAWQEDPWAWMSQSQEDRSA